MVSTMINLNKPSRPFYQWLGPILLFALFTIWLNVIPWAHANTPPGLPSVVVPGLVQPGTASPYVPQDAFSLPSATGKTNKAINITLSGTQKQTMLVDSVQNIYGLSITGDVNLLDNNASSLKVILVDNSSQKEYLVYETYPALTDNPVFSIQELCEETCILPLINTFSLRIELENASISIREVAYTDAVPTTSIEQMGVGMKTNREIAKIQKLNQQQLGWVAGETSVSKLSYEDKKQLFLTHEVPNLQGFEYYRGGVFEIKSNTPRKPSASALVTDFDWRNRHGENWVTSVKDQGQCGSCWAFASTGATEAVTNLYFNQHLDLDLAEQDTLSCSGAGSCDGGLPGEALNFFTHTGIVGEACFPYSTTDQSCQNKCSNPAELIGISGKIDFVSPQSEDTLKRMIIDNGPVSGGIYSWSHAMALVGFTTDAKDGQIAWIFKNSWGDWGDNGYGNLKLDINDIGWTHAIVNPVISTTKSYQIHCVDRDNDNYCNWGIAKDKPATCPASCKLERDCDDSNPSAGPFDANYNCGENVLPTTKQFNIFNDGDAELLVSSITPESSAPWISVTPTTFSVPAKGTQMVIVQIDYTQAPVGRSATRLLVNSNDPDETPFPNGVNIVVERPNLTTTGTLPILGEPVALSAPNSPVNTTSKFSGGIAVNDQSFLQQVILHLSDKVDVRGEITVDPAHIGQPADIFVYAEATLPPSPETYYFMLGEGLNILTWDKKNSANLATFMQATLGATQTVPMYQGTFFYPGTLKVYFGYRLLDGTVVTSGQGIDITILP